jgi:hypothetical protein
MIYVGVEDDGMRVISNPELGLHVREEPLGCFVCYKGSIDDGDFVGQEWGVVHTWMDALNWAEGTEVKSFKYIYTPNQMRKQ